MIGQFLISSFTRVGILIVLIGPFVFACREEAQASPEGSAMLVREIQDRLDGFVGLSDSLKAKKIDPSAIHKRFQELLLMSKDVENLQACVNMHKNYLDETCRVHELNRSQLLEINSSMSLEQIELVLKQNELQLLNQIWLQLFKGTIELQSVK